MRAMEKWKKMSVEEKAVWRARADAKEGANSNQKWRLGWVRLQHLRLLCIDLVVPLYWNLSIHVLVIPIFDPTYQLIRVICFKKNKYLHKPREFPQSPFLALFIFLFSSFSCLVSSRTSRLEEKTGVPFSVSVFVALAITSAYNYGNEHGVTHWWCVSRGKTVLGFIVV